MGACQSKVGIAPDSPAKTRRGKKLSRAQLHLVKKYLPNFALTEGARPEHVRTVGAFWNAVFRDSESTQGTSSASGTSGASAASTVSYTSISRAKVKVQQLPRRVLLLSRFYSYLDKHAPQLSPVFQASYDVRSNVLEHITVGMRSLLQFATDMDKMLAITRTHLRFGVQPEYYDPLGLALLHALKEVSRHYWTQQVEFAWRQLYGYCSLLLLEIQLNALEPATTPRKSRQSDRDKRLPKEQIALVKKYLPSFNYSYESTEEHRRLAALNWNAVFSKDERVRAMRAPGSEVDDVDSVSSVSQLSGRSVRRLPVVAESEYQPSVIGLLYDIFYEYVEANEPELKDVFRSSMHTKSKVLLHISLGMRTLLQAPDMADRVVQLTDTHMMFGVEMQHFNPLGLALIHALKNCSGDEWSAEVETAWRRLFGHCSAILLQAQQNAVKRKPTKTMRR
ncbi:TPA: hypothetical protein N0F65_007563 [Lagenidium giganteum]|uniref:Globin domain-containing protein n=1 Tax=Lagenidium giganteum TaxID=4803 RepID=A0AAV2ZHV9_9STRA|nr:TPA: hypothetical protein N0F65_007563 [Lagenidium giganteum]